MKLNLQVFLQAYSDSVQTSTPALSNFKWSREIFGIPYTVENSQQLQVATSTTTSNLISGTPTFVYLESDQEVSVIYNGGSAVTITPFSINGVTKPAIFMIAGSATSLTITNSGSTTANIFFASMG